MSDRASHTTRGRYADEIAGKDYYFVPLDDFERGIKMVCFHNVFSDFYAIHWWAGLSEKLRSFQWHIWTLFKIGYFLFALYWSRHYSALETFYAFLLYKLIVYCIVLLQVSIEVVESS